jgi:two-component system chemotaxis response regulator CheY
MIALVVDDETDARELMRDTLEAAGWRVEIAEDGIAGLGRIPRIRPDVVLLDLCMPNLDGEGMLRMLRSTLGGRAVRVVLTTGAEVTPEVEALADAVLTKPFGPAQLLDAVRHIGSAAR